MERFENDVKLNGKPVNFEVAVNLMDDEIREQLHNDGITDKQEFLDRYCEKHLAKYGKTFEIN